MRESKPQLGSSSPGNQDFLQGVKIVIIVAKWNIDFNESMLVGAKDALMASSIQESNIDVVYVPGAFEMPIMAQRLAETDKYQAILCFGTIIKGETVHFDLVANESARGIMQISLDYEVPVLNGILAVNSLEQAEERASLEKENKGYEVAMSAIDLLLAIESIN